MRHLTLIQNVLWAGDLVLMAQVEMVLLGLFCQEAFGWFANVRW